jgi:multiple RNA-binding domain-containing protein 1
MSRVCVKNVPAYVTEKRLQDFFKVKGDVTDVKIVRTKDGKSRHMAFIGYASEDAAAAAIRHFNRAYLDATRLTVEAARPIGSDDGVGDRRAGGVVRGRGASASAASGKGSRAAASADTPAAASREANPKLKEFLKVMQPRHASALWANDDAVGVSGGTVSKRRSVTGAAAGARGSGSDDGDSSSGDSGDTSDSSGSDSEDDAAGQTAGGSGADATSESDDEAVGETGRLFVRNLTYTVSDDDVSALFSKFGTLSRVHVARDEAKRAKGFA